MRFETRDFTLLDIYRYLCGKETDLSQLGDVFPQISPLEHNSAAFARIL